MAQIERANVDRLEIVWRRPGTDRWFAESFEGLGVSDYLRSTPVVLDGVLYAPNGIGLVEAFDPASGETVWLQQPFAATLEEARGRSTKGVDAWSSGVDRRLFVVREPYLYALDRKNGEYVKSFGDRGRVLLTPDGARTKATVRARARSWSAT